MQVVSKVSDIRRLVQEYRQQGKSIGFVPTMGYLHEGHLTLMRRAKTEQAVVIASIFVNPLQFGQNEDYSVYPRDIDRDSKLAADAGVNVIFAPTVEEMYPNGYENMLTTVNVTGLTDRLCGASRPGHFRGVTTVVAKLFNIVKPDAAYFGQKDAQQVAVIRQMVEDLNMDIVIVAVPIVREYDGLALSSRNIFLDEAERKAALILSKSLQLAGDMLRQGERSAIAIETAMNNLINSEKLATIDYIDISHANTLTKLETINCPALFALAVKIGKTRLIDNMIWEG